MRFGTLLITLLALCAPAGADVLYLEGGGRVEGVVTDEGRHYVVRSTKGTARVERARVAKRVRLPYVTEVYEERRGAVGPEDADGRFLLALWCSTNGLARQGRTHLMEVLLIDPDHARARARLGFIRHEGVWMMPEEAKDAAMAARGYVRFDGRWFTPEGLLAWIDARQELARLNEEIAQRKVEREKAKLEALREAEKLAKERAERKALEQAMARAEADRIERERLARQNEEMLRLLRDMYLRNSYGYSTYGYGYGIPHRGYDLRRYTRPGCTTSGPRLSFRWSRGNFHIRGVVR